MKIIHKQKRTIWYLQLDFVESIFCFISLWHFIFTINFTFNIETEDFNYILSLMSIVLQTYNEGRYTFLNKLFPYYFGSVTVTKKQRFLLGFPSFSRERMWPEESFVYEFKYLLPLYFLTWDFSVYFPFAQPFLLPFLCHDNMVYFSIRLNLTWTIGGCWCPLWT